MINMCIYIYINGNLILLIINFINYQFSCVYILFRLLTKFDGRYIKFDFELSKHIADAPEN